MRRFVPVALLAAVLLAVPPGAGVPAQPPKPAPKGKKVALLVGVNKYENRKLDDLKYAEADVTDLAAILKKGGFEVRVLLGSAAGKDKATRDNVQAALAEALKGVTKRDTVLLAFSGHGAQLFVDVEEDGKKARKEVPFFCPVDAVPTDPGTLVSVSGVLKALDDRGGGHNLLLVDACRDVADPNKGKRGGIDSARVENLGEGTAVFLSCASRQKARETDKAGGGHGVFFHFVLEGLKGEAKNEAGEVTWERLVPYVKGKVKAEFPKWFDGLPDDERQKPQSLGNLTDDPVLLTAGDAQLAADARNLDAAVKSGNGTDDFYRTRAPLRLAAWRRGAESGDPVAMLLYGRCLLTGVGVEKDEQAAVSWYRKAADAGEGKAMNNLGSCLEYGRGVDKDEKAAVTWYRKAADVGEANAMWLLGLCHEDGRGVDKDEKAALSWYRKAANAGSHAAANSVGVCYEYGRGVERDVQEAARWYRKAAEAGTFMAMVNLGNCYAGGLGVEKDEKQAATWYRKAADAGRGEGMVNLGKSYEFGRGVDKDVKQAAAWYRKGADAGVLEGMLNLARCYEFGTGIDRDGKQAATRYREAHKEALRNGRTDIAEQAEAGLARLGLTP